MNISVGIVGLPNVGKSTLFNTLTNISVPAENYPFCTIDPNIGVVEVKDPRLDMLAKLSVSKKKIYPVIEFVDIAGLVRDAHKGEGLGNQFLGNIKKCNAIIQIIRVFNTPNILHVENRINPLEDKEIIETELLLKDLETINNRLAKLEKEKKTNPYCAEELVEVLKLKAALEEGHFASSVSRPLESYLLLARTELFLITDKPFLYLLNIDDELFDPQELIKTYRKELDLDNKTFIIPVNVKQEYELSVLTSEERDQLINDLGIDYSAINKLISAAYDILGLMTFFTSGEMETRGWTILKNASILEAAGTIHSDFATKFIAAEVVSYDDFILSNGWEGARRSGKLRLEGRDYNVKDADVIIFKHGA